jgi:hypothetical protein
MVTTPPQPHCQLRVHALVDVDAAASKVLKRPSSDKHGRSEHHPHKGGALSSGSSPSARQTVHALSAARNIGSKSSGGASSSWSEWTGS